MSPIRSEQHRQLGRRTPRDGPPTPSPGTGRSALETAADENGEKHRDPGRDMKVEDLLDQPHGGLVGGAHDQERCADEHHHRDPQETTKKPVLTSLSFCHDRFESP